MLKTQMKFQKFTAFASLIAAVVVFVYALGFITSLHSTLYYTLTDPDDPTAETRVQGTEFYYELQSNVSYDEVTKVENGKTVVETVKHKTIGYNDKLVTLGIVLIVAALLVLISGSHRRRKYYIGNYITTGVLVLSFLGAAGFITVSNLGYLEKFRSIDFAALKEFCELWGYTYGDSTLCFTLGFVLSGVLVAVAALAVANLIWKISLIRRENKLLTSNEAKEATQGV